MKNKKGFTLVELLVVIAIIAILAAVVAPNAFKAIEKSKITAIESDYRAIKTATFVYYSDTGLWPETGAKANGFTEKKYIDGTTIDRWNGPYLDVWKDKSPLGNGYAFVNASDPAVTTTDPKTETLPSEITSATSAAPADAIYLKITALPNTAYDTLLSHLGKEQVFKGTETEGKSDVYLLIATK